MGRGRLGGVGKDLRRQHDATVAEPPRIATTAQSSAAQPHSRILHMQCDAVGEQADLPSETGAVARLLGVTEAGGGACGS